MNNHDASETRDILTGFLSGGRVEEGVKFFEGRSQDLPELIRLECLGNIGFYQRNIAEAINFYEAAMSLSPEHVIPQYLYLAGVKNELKGDLIGAFDCYQAAIDADSSFVDAYVELGALLFKVGDLKGAVQCYRDAVRLEPNDLANLHNLKAVLMKLDAIESGQYKEEVGAVEAVYRRLEEGGGKLPISNKW